MFSIKKKISKYLHLFNMLYNVINMIYDVISGNHKALKSILLSNKSISLYNKWSLNRELFLDIISNLRVSIPNNIPLKRFGKPYDGGYILADALEKVQNAYSFEIGGDVSWDIDVANHGINIYQFDPTIKKLPMEHPRFTFKEVGIYGGDFQFFPRNNNYTFLNLEAIVRHYTPDDNNLLLKMDVEGYEYESLLTCKNILPRFSQMVIEFHGLTDPMWAKLFCEINFYIRKTHEIIHVHANNHGEIVTIDGNTISDVMEFTYFRREEHVFVPSESFYPTKLDSPNLASNQK